MCMKIPTPYWHGVQCFGISLNLRFVLEQFVVFVHSVFALEWFSVFLHSIKVFALEQFSAVCKVSENAQFTV